MKVLIIDNIDSFVYNLYQYVGELGADVVVKRNNITPTEIEKINPEKIIISPGPGTPEKAGNSVEIVKKLGKTTPILGVCLGHQAIGVAYGATVGRANTLMHGKTSAIEHDGKTIYDGVKNPLTATRYHSLAIKENSLPEDLIVTARSIGDNTIMGVRHREHPVEGVQFHPESILTNTGKQIIKNFLYHEKVVKMKEYINKLIEQQDLGKEEAEEAMKTIMSGGATDAQIAAFLTALRLKGETTEEISACARIMRDFAATIHPKVEGTLVDTCGTGGDMIKTFNISTISAFVVAAAGIPIAKHGNRSVTSKAGSADLLEAMGVKIGLTPEEVEKNIEDIGIGFMFAPGFHSAMKHVIGARREMGIRTVFNILGPLTNPAHAQAQVLGVFDPDLTETMANVLKDLGTERALVVHGMEGLDEISTIGETKVSELKDGDVRTYTIKPEDFGIKRATKDELQGGDAAENAKIATSILKDGEKSAKRDIVVLNAAAGIYVGGKADTIKDAIKIAEDAIDTGAAYEKLELLIKHTNATT